MKLYGPANKSATKSLSDLLLAAISRVHCPSIGELNRVVARRATEQRSAKASLDRSHVAGTGIIILVLFYDSTLSFQSSEALSCPSGPPFKGNWALQPVHLTPKYGFLKPASRKTGVPPQKGQGLSSIVTFRLIRLISS